MCNGSSSRTTQGGTIAILKPLQPSLQHELSLRLINTDSESQTKAIVSGLDGEGHFIVHRDGDLTSQQPLDASVLHRFQVTNNEQFLAPRMDLGVGGDGIIGRRVSLIQNQILVGQGIIGWN
ncbi:hypothetical protein HII31_09356 [Pseudocercospora fuligena]|uniref:Uncharacterized protein n=1 Tax=Pseudocercospora fuligena TaxID=685502 RepID=A0A8H6RE16_9PEZI|nr:hypothetical protein HII31_09356 [Pseudocercospora fuligena]